MSKKHFEEIAKMIFYINDIDSKIKLANWFCNFFAKYNKQFNEKKFLNACGIFHYTR